MINKPELLQCKVMVANNTFRGIVSLTEQLSVINVAAEEITIRDTFVSKSLLDSIIDYKALRGTISNTIIRYVR